MSEAPHVIVLGTGGAGFTAAISAHEAGARVSLFEKGERACLDRGIETQTGHRAVRLLMDGDHVAGVVFQTADSEVEVAADAVVLATGGFEWDADMLRAFIRGPMAHPLSPKTNTRDGLKMAMRADSLPALAARHAARVSAMQLEDAA